MRRNVVQVRVLFHSNIDMTYQILYIRATHSLQWKKQSAVGFLPASTNPEKKRKAPKTQKPIKAHKSQKPIKAYKSQKPIKAYKSQKPKKMKTATTQGMTLLQVLQVQVPFSQRKSKRVSQSDLDSQCPTRGGV